MTPPKNIPTTILEINRHLKYLKSIKSKQPSNLEDTFWYWTNKKAELEIEMKNIESSIPRSSAGANHVLNHNKK